MKETYFKLLPVTDDTPQDSHHWLWIVPILITMCTCMVCCSSPFWRRWYDLWKHERAWEQQNINNYRLTITLLGDDTNEIAGLDATGELIVCDRQIEQIDHLGMLVPCETVLESSECKRDPIEDLFQYAWSTNPILSNLEYDEYYHYPRQVDVHGGGVVVRDFQPITCD